MTYDTPPLGHDGAVWSGRCLADRCLVRAFSLGPGSHRLTLEPLSGIPVVLDAPPAGATYLVGRDGVVRP